MSIKKKIEELQNSSIPMHELIKNVSENAFLYTSELIGEINIARIKQDDSLLEAILVFASRDGINKNYSDILCKILKEDWHYSHEDIVMMLDEIRNPDSINCIYETSLNIPDYDDGRSLAKKCIWALGSINTSESQAKLNLLANSDDPIIKEAALMEINSTKVRRINS